MNDNNFFENMTDSELVDFYVPRDGLRAAAGLMDSVMSKHTLSSQVDPLESGENPEYLKGMAEVLTYMSGLPDITDTGNEIVARRILELSATGNY